MKFRFQSFVVISVLIISLFMIQSSSSPSPISQIEKSPNLNWTGQTEKLQGGLAEYMESNTIPDDFNNKILVYSRSQSLGIDSFIPEIKLGNSYLHFIDEVTTDLVRQLYLNDDVITMIPDSAIEYNKLLNSDQSSRNPGFKPNSFVVEDIIDTRRVHDELGFTGEGVTIGVIDSGIDFGISDLTNSAVIADNGYLAAFDSTGTGLAITGLTVPSELSQGRDILPIGDEVFDVFLGAQGAIRTNEELGIRLEDMDINDISTPSVSNSYKVGIAAQETLVEGLPNQYFIFVLIDSQTAGVYDTLYVDMETSLGISLALEGIIIPASRIYEDLTEFSISNDQPFGANNPIPAKDITGDGVNDISMGGLGRIIDYNGLSGDFVFSGIHPSGSAIAMFFDPVGHGTLVASSAAGDGETLFPVYDDKETEVVENATSYRLTGSAPDAKIVGHKAFSLSEFVLGWLTTGGLTLVEDEGDLVWVEEPDNLVDISSNSWGDGTVAPNNLMKGFDENSLLLDFLSTPNSLYDDYPGVVFVVSSGNGAPGYGTTASPGMASMAITVGASSSYHYLNGSSGKNDVAWFSARGPSSYGTIKPDVVAPGYSGFVNIQVIQGYGNGTYASGPFSGTSEAAPRVTGVLALIYEAMINQSMFPSFETLRLALKSTTMDLGFDPSQQGAGLINAYEAVMSIIDSRPVISSSYSSEIVAENLGDTFFNIFEMEHPLVVDPIEDFVQSVTTEQLRAGIDLHIRYSNGTNIASEDYSIEVLRPELDYSNNMTIQSTDITYDGSISEIFPANLANYRFMDLSLTMSEETWEAMFGNGLQTPDIVLYDGGSQDLVSDIISFTTWSQVLYSGFPGDDFLGEPRITFTDPGFEEIISDWDGIEYEIRSRFFSNNLWSAVSATPTDGNLNLQHVTVVNEYQTGYVSLSIENSEILMPLVVSPSHNAEYAEDLQAIGSELEVEQPYNQFQVTNVFDWGYRAESGDFNHYKISVPDNATYLAAFANWTSTGLQPNMYLFNSSGNLITKSDTKYLGGGFYDTRTSEDSSQNLLVEANDDVYYLMIHTTNLPYHPGPFDLNVYFRYLTIPSLPNPNPVYSQNINSQIEGTLNIDASSYSIPEFPEFKINSINAQFYTGSNISETRTTLNDDLTGGVNRQYVLSNYDDFFVIDAEAGEKIYVKLSWEGDIDADIHVFKLDDQPSQQNDLLKGLGTTPGSTPEEGIFAAEKAGEYAIFVDYVSGAGFTDDFTYTFEYESRFGPTLVSDDSSIDLDTTLFPDDAYGIILTFGSNFGYKFIIIINLTTENSEPFTFELTNPVAGGELEEIVGVNWQSSRIVDIDIILVIDGIEILLGSVRSDGSFSFDSSFYKNGAARVKVIATDGIYGIIIVVPVTLNNDQVSSLPEVQESDPNNLEFNFILPLIASLMVIHKLKNRKNQF